jgi:two-component system NarL family response regulator
MTQAESCHLPSAVQGQAGQLGSFRRGLKRDAAWLGQAQPPLDRRWGAGESKPLQHGTSSRRRVLLVDDDSVLLGNLKRLLQADRPQWEVLTAVSGADAMRILRAEPLDLLVSDIQMPGMDGMALLAEVRRDPALARLPLIFITARDDRASMRNSMASGADDYLTKPFSPDELIQAMEGRLKRRDQEAAPTPGGGMLFDELASLLTGRELEVLALIGQGLVTKDIAAALDLSYRTVSVHRANIMRKLDLHNAAALAALATQASIA